MQSERKTKNKKNIEVYLSGGSCWTVNMDVDTFAILMADDIMKDHEFIPLTFPDGSRGYVRKDTIQGFCEEVED